MDARPGRAKNPLAPPSAPGEGDLVGARADDMLSELTLATAAGLGLGSIANIIHPYRTQAEVMNKGLSR